MHDRHSAWCDCLLKYVEGGLKDLKRHVATKKHWNKTKLRLTNLRTRRLGNTDFSFILYDVFSWMLSLLKHWQSSWNQTCTLHLVHIFSIDSSDMLMDFHQTWSQYSHQPCPFMLLDFDPNLTFVILIFFCYYLCTFLCCTLKNLFSSLLILPHEMASPVVLNVLKPSAVMGESYAPFASHRGFFLKALITPLQKRLSKITLL